MIGDAGNDIIYGGAGDDTIFGDKGNDTLDGGDGTNTYFDAEGDDTYIIRSLLDRIYDNGGNDKGIIYADWYRPISSVETWTWAPGVQQLPNWIAALAEKAPTSRINGEAKTVLYHFAQTPAAFFGENDKLGFMPFNDIQRTFTRKVFDYVSSVLNVQFRESDNPNDETVLVMANNRQTNSAGYANSRILMLNTSEANLAPSASNSGVATLLHELGHSLGLKHPFSHPDANGDVGQGPYLDGIEDVGRNTLMSYNKGSSDYHLSYSPFDIAALQYLYGPAQGLSAGNTIWVLDSKKANFIADGSGRDTLDASAIADSVTLDLRPGYWSFLGDKTSSIVSPAQVTINFGTVIEDLLGGAGNDRLTGNEIANHIKAGAGNDTIMGSLGSDILDGGVGMDIAAYLGKLDSYSIKIGKDGVTVSDKNRANDIDWLTGIERLKFDDTMVTLDIYGSAGQAYRLYQAAFNRTPDLGGMGYW